ncbi:XRE family transcriptional regulator [Photobacterium piscicola]|uniref:XRE family transcriptional regulator n=1 Tax=Photobacterium piscicola TaxID=1378299 RepID=UPI003736734D
MTYNKNIVVVKNNAEGVIHNNVITPFKERLRAAIGGESIRKFAKRCELSPSTLSNYLIGDTYPTLDRLAVIAQTSGASYSWLATGIAPITPSKDMICVPQYDLRASAGTGCLVVAENPVAEFSFSKEWLIRNNLYNAKLTVIPVYGDSMEPTLMDEDLMLVKLVDNPGQARDGVCVIRIDDDIFVKRIQFDYERQGYHIVSDNIAYRPFFIGSEFEGRFDVLGRMVRVLQKAKQAV